MFTSREREREKGEEERRKMERAMFMEFRKCISMTMKLVVC
jgi:hypothetical protein